MNSIKSKNKRSQFDSLSKRDRYISLIESFLENFLAVFLDPIQYYQSFKNYISFQFRIRTKYFIIGVILLFISIFLIFFFLVFFYLLLYEVIQHITKNTLLTYLILSWISFIFFFIVIYNSLNYFYKIGSKIKTQKERIKNEK